MNVSEFENDKRVRAFSILAVIWFSLVFATGAFIPVMSVVPEGPALDLLKPIFLTVSMTMLSLAFLIVILVTMGVVSVPRTPEEEHRPWPVTLLAAFFFACVFASGPVSRTADRVGTEAALAQLGLLFGLFMLPFIILAIIVPAIIGRFSSSYASKAKTWGYFTAMLIGFGLWWHVSAKPLSFILNKLPAMAVLVIGYLLFLAARAILSRRNARI